MDNKVVLITGANRGLGLAMSEKIAKMGATVVMACRDKKKGAEAAAKLSQKGLKVVSVAIDVSSTDSIEAGAKEIASKFPVIDVLINNAAISNEPDGSNISKMQLKYYHEMMNTNVLGTLWMCKAFTPLLVKSTDARVINFSSGLGQLTVPRMGPNPTYSISKTAVNAVTKILADELKNTSVMVFSVDPGWIKTDMGGPNAMLEIPEGIDTPVWLATTPKKDLQTGEFYKERKVLGW